VNRDHDRRSQGRSTARTTGTPAQRSPALSLGEHLVVRFHRTFTRTHAKRRPSVGAGPRPRDARPEVVAAVSAGLQVPGSQLLDAVEVDVAEDLRNKRGWPAAILADLDCRGAGRATREVSRDADRPRRGEITDQDALSATPQIGLIRPLGPARSSGGSRCAPRAADAYRTVGAQGLRGAEAGRRCTSPRSRG
jgi:hypothetical protein